MFFYIFTGVATTLTTPGCRGISWRSTVDTRITCCVSQHRFSMEMYFVIDEKGRRNEGVVGREVTVGARWFCMSVGRLGTLIRMVKWPGARGRDAQYSAIMKLQLDGRTGGRRVRLTERLRDGLGSDDAGAWAMADSTFSPLAGAVSRESAASSGPP